MQRGMAVPCLEDQLGEERRCHFRIRFYSIAKGNLACMTELPRPAPALEAFEKV